MLFEDECHLKHGDTTGYVWGPKGQRVEVPMMNEKHSKTFYGALNMFNQQFHLKQFDKANMENTVEFLRWLMEEVYVTAKRIFIIWDGATYHTGQIIKDFLHSINGEVKKSKWKVHCILFAPNAPDQNPTEDCWLKAKNNLRKLILQNPTFTQVVKCFTNSFTELDFDFNKLKWYC